MSSYHGTNNNNHINTQIFFQAKKFISRRKKLQFETDKQKNFLNSTVLTQ